MKIGIIALCVALAALGFGVFAVADNLKGEDARTLYVPVPASPIPGWSDAQCEDARISLDKMQFNLGYCARSDRAEACVWLQIAIAENCPDAPFEIVR